MAEPDAFQRRASTALVVAAVAGLAAAIVAAEVVDLPPYADGVELFLPTTLSAAAAGSAVLVGFAVLEARRGNGVRLTRATRTLARIAFWGGIVGLVGLGLPLVLAVPYAAVVAGLCLVASLVLGFLTRHANPTSIRSHTGVQSPPGGEG